MNKLHQDLLSQRVVDRREDVADELLRVAKLFEDYAKRISREAERCKTALSYASSGINEIENCLRNINFASIARIAMEASAYQSELETLNS